MDKKRGEKFAAEFYKSWKWRKCRDAFVQKKGGLCERCLKNGDIVLGTQVHHKTRLTPDNLKDPKIALNFDNLELLCDECHEAEHKVKHWRTDENGHVEL